MPVGQDPFVAKLMAGIFNDRIPVSRYADTVLSHIINLGPNTGLSDKLLTHKLAMRLAMSSTSRASAPQGLNLSLLKDEGDSVEFTIAKLTKTRCPGRKSQIVSFHSYAQNKLFDVVDCIRTYIVRIRTWRLSEKQHNLLLGIIAPHQQVVTSTISKWLKQLMS